LQIIPGAAAEGQREHPLLSFLPLALMLPFEKAMKRPDQSESVYRFWWQIL
jgi:hypothetical protein